MTRNLAISIVAIVMFGAACGDATSGSPGPATDTSSQSSGGSAASSTTATRSAALESAVPEEGATVDGQFMMGAVVSETNNPLEVHFFLDGSDVGVVKKFPYAVQADACQLSAGNHAYSVVIMKDGKPVDYLDQWFVVKPCQ